VKKYLWGIVAGLCVMALLIVAAVIFIPRLLDSGSSPEIPEGHKVMMPEHWWKAEMNEQQLGALSTCWGQGITAAQLLQTLWPDVLQQLPDEAMGAYESQEIHWPTEEYGDWDVSAMICGAKGVSHSEGQTLYEYYLGSYEWEETTLVKNTDRGFTEDRMYRVSLYISKQPE
jgi:hypothetical protein